MAFYRKNILDFAWAADKDYSVETFIVPDGPKVNFVYQKSEKNTILERSSTLHITKYFQLMNATFGRYVYPLPTVLYKVEMAEWNTECVP